MPALRDMLQALARKNDATVDEVLTRELRDSVVTCSIRDARFSSEAAPHPTLSPNADPSVANILPGRGDGGRIRESG